MNKQRGKAWYRIEFFDGSFIYLPLRFRMVLTTISKVKYHGKITNIRKMENRV